MLEQFHGTTAASRAEAENANENEEPVILSRNSSPLQNTAGNRLTRGKSQSRLARNIRSETTDDLGARHIAEGPPAGGEDATGGRGDRRRCGAIVAPGQVLESSYVDERMLTLCVERDFYFWPAPPMHEMPIDLDTQPDLSHRRGQGRRRR